jgi:phosphoglucosamine mutase
MRGTAGEYPLDTPTLVQLGEAMARHLLPQTGDVPRIVLGRDTRASGEWIEEALLQGIVGAGAVAITVGVVPTPGVAYLTRHYGATAGVVISASHNPYQDNGIKIFSPNGQKMGEEFELSLESDLINEEGSRVRAGSIGPSGRHEKLSPAPYQTWLSEQVAAGLRLDGVRMVIDCAHGSATDFAPPLFESLGATVDLLHNSPTGQNINLGCGAVHPESLQARVLETGADLGLAFDGDADRLVMVDEQGQLLDGDHLLYLLAKRMSSDGQLSNGQVVATVMSNFGLEVALRSLQLTLVRTPVGDKHVLDELLRCRGNLGGEQSGHIILPRISLAGDGMVTAVEVLRSLVASHTPLSDLTCGMVRLPQRLLNIPVVRKPPLDQLPELQEALANATALLGTEGRILVRYSGTEGIVRLMIEARGESLLDEAGEPVAEVLKQLLCRER